MQKFSISAGPEQAGLNHNRSKILKSGFLVLGFEWYKQHHKDRVHTGMYE